MFAPIALIAGSALLAPILGGAPALPSHQLNRLTYASADDRALARFAAATHDYVAYGKQGALFTPDLAPIFAFRLQVARWLRRHDTFETLDTHALVDAVWPGHRPEYLAALPELPDELDYRIAGPHLLLVDRRTEAVVDLLCHVLRER